MQGASPADVKAQLVSSATPNVIQDDPALADSLNGSVSYEINISSTPNRLLYCMLNDQVSLLSSFTDPPSQTLNPHTLLRVMCYVCPSKTCRQIHCLLHSALNSWVCSCLPANLPHMTYGHMALHLLFGWSTELMRCRTHDVVRQAFTVLVTACLVI